MCIYDLSTSTGCFYKCLLNTMVHCKELSRAILINLKSDLGFQCQTRTKLITLDELDQKMFFAFLVIPANGERSPLPNTAIMNCKLCLCAGSKRSYVGFEGTVHKYT